MTKVRILAPFEGYPDGATRTVYAAGQELDVPADFGDLIVTKGHAERVAPKARKKEAGE